MSRMNFAILESKVSFSSGNAFPVYAREFGIAVFGETSGGGECNLAPFFFQNGLFGMISGPSKSVTLSGAVVDDGAEPDYALVKSDDDGNKDYSLMYNVKLLDRLVHEYYGDYTNEWAEGVWYDKNHKGSYEGIGAWTKLDDGCWTYKDSLGWYPKNRWQKIDGKWYFFDKDGCMEANAYKDGYYLTKSGAWDEEAPTGKWKKNLLGWRYVLSDKTKLSDTWKLIDGKWFWWGTDGAKPCVALYKLMFDIFVNQKGLHNLIWVWTTDEASDALDWYPGDEYVDVVGRDYYYYPRESNHSSLIGSFETVKEIFGGKKIVALSENGSVPYPDEMKADGANWSWFMPWYGDYAMEGWANDNTKESWKTVMNNEYTLTLEDMPGWDKYEMQEVPTIVNKGVSGVAKASASLSVIGKNLQISVLNNAANATAKVAIFDMQGNQVMNYAINGTSASINLSEIAAGQYIVKVQGKGFTQNGRILVK